jgi:hypothetical protein
VPFLDKYKKKATSYMNHEIIICPHCENEIPLTEVLTHQIADTLKKEMEQDIRKQEDQLAKRKEELRSKEDSLKKSEAGLDDKLQRLLKEKQTELSATARKKAMADSEVLMKDLQEQLGEQTEKLNKARETELSLRKKERELEEKAKTQALDLEKKLSAALDVEKQKAIQAFQESQQLKDAAYEKKINDMKTLLDETKRKAEQGSMQTQGEVLELSLEEALISAFRYDEIDPVGKGIKGADVIQTVKDKSHQPCGKIIWESKNTKNWVQGWVQKLKDDQVAAGGDIAIIVTEAMPAEFDNFGMVENVWVTRKALAIPLATVLRDSLADLTYARNSAEGMNEKMQYLYQYIIGPEFKQKVEGIIDTFSGMKNQLDKEKRAMTKLWKEREKQIDRVVVNTSGMYGDFKGVIGAALADIESLELGDGLAEGDE